VGTVLHLTDDRVGDEKLPMSVSQLTSYLRGAKYALRLAGVNSFLREGDT